MVINSSLFIIVHYMATAAQQLHVYAVSLTSYKMFKIGELGMRVPEGT
jgi:hypothetical protein